MTLRVSGDGYFISAMKIQNPAAPETAATTAPKTTEADTTLPAETQGEVQTEAPAESEAQTAAEG